MMAGPAIAAGLEVMDQSGRVLARVAAQDWCVVWNHSVAGFEVRDCYVLRDGQMLLQRSHQPDFAAGLGHIPGRGVARSDGAGGYWIEDINEAVPGNCYRLRVGSETVNHRIVTDDRDISLSEIAAGESVILRRGTEGKGRKFEC